MQSVAILLLFLPYLPPNGLPFLKLVPQALGLPLFHLQSNINTGLISGGAIHFLALVPIGRS